MRNQWLSVCCKLVDRKVEAKEVLIDDAVLEYDFVKASKHNLYLSESIHLNLEAHRFVHIYDLCVDGVCSTQPRSFFCSIFLPNLGHSKSPLFLCCLVLVFLLLLWSISLLDIPINVILCLDQPVLKTFDCAFSWEHVKEIFFEYFLTVAISVNVEIDGLIYITLINDAQLLRHLVAYVVLKKDAGFLLASYKRCLVAVHLLTCTWIVRASRVFETPWSILRRWLVKG
jgi:hypothetical protein